MTRWCAIAFGCALTWIAVAEPVNVWIDADPSAGLFEQEVDDALALIQAFNSPRLNIHGIGIVYGNAPLDKAFPIGEQLTERFGPEGLSVFAGAASKDELGDDNDAVRAMAAAIEQTPLTILALGPVTNVGSLLMQHPDLHARIERIVVVAGRRPGQRFTPYPDQVTAATDFNFEHDPEAMQVILDSDIEFVMAPWEVSSQVWITKEDIENLRGSGPTGDWLASNTSSWIARWKRRYGVEAFNPFDSLAIGWATHPGLVETIDVTVRIETLPNDMLKEKPDLDQREKPYLLIDTERGGERPAVYAYKPKPGFKPMLLEHLKGRIDE
jgi:inosine-uridine nucleoside N-ribohydrolase